MNSLNAARRARNLSIDDLAARTRISRRYVEAIDEGRLSDLPAGLYGRAYVRAVAAQVGVQGAELEELVAALAPAPDPLPVLQEVHAGDSPTFEFRLPGDLRVHVAAAIDAAVLLALNSGVLTVIAAACGVRPGALVRMTPAPLAVLCAAIWIVYFVLLGGVLGSTVGQFVCGLGLPDAKPLRLAAIVQRALGISADAMSDAEGPSGLHRSTADPASPA